MKLNSIITFLLSLIIFPAGAQIYITNNGQAEFTSDAPLELITAKSDGLSGAINIDDNQFAFRIANKSFIGFNSALQQEHFYENYIETDKYKYSNFQGKIIEKIDLSIKDPQEVRAKGILSIHGIDQERIVKASVLVDDSRLLVECHFTVPLEDHDIRIPNVVYQKIAEIIDVTVSAELILKKD